MKLSSRWKYWVSSFFFRYCAGLVGYSFFFVARVLLSVGLRVKGLGFLLTSIRFNYSPRAIRLLSALLVDAAPIFYKMLGYQPSPKEAAIRTIVLSLPIAADSGIKKGVIVITFTTTLAFYLRHPQFDLLNKYFVFVLEPSWAGYAIPEILLFLMRAEHCLVQSSEQKDQVLLNALFPSGVATSIGASDWVNPAVFSPDGADKYFDSIYVANLNPIKRAYRYIDAVANAQAKVPHYKACLVCAGWGGATQDLIAYIAAKGLGDVIQFIPGLERRELVKAVNRSKVNVLLSFKEGSNRSLFEAMFSNVPVICLAENIGVNKSYINEFTGLLVPDIFLEDALLSFVEGWRGYSPRAWALSNISPQRTTDKLTQLLASKFGDRCNSGLAVKSNDPEVVYLDSPVSNIELNEALFQVLAQGDETQFVDYLSQLVLPAPHAR